MRWAALGFLLCIAVLGAVLLPPIPRNWVPWKTPALDSPATVFAHMQINRLKIDSAACLAALQGASRLRFEPQADRKTGVSCEFSNVVRATELPVSFNYNPVATCSVMAALYWWQSELQTLAMLHLGSPVAHIDQMGTYACRNVNSRITGSRSQHAAANAIDIAAFTLADGRRISVLRNWDKDAAEGRFLKAAHKAACRYFNGVLGPDYNKLHHNHFHLDIGPYLMCR
jgi:hypothetical protein